MQCEAVRTAPLAATKLSTSSERGTSKVEACFRELHGHICRLKLLLITNFLKISPELEGHQMAFSITRNNPFCKITFPRLGHSHSVNRQIKPEPRRCSVCTRTRLWIYSLGSQSLFYSMTPIFCLDILCNEIFRCR